MTQQESLQLIQKLYDLKKAHPKEWRIADIITDSDEIYCADCLEQCSYGSNDIDGFNYCDICDRSDFTECGGLKKMVLFGGETIEII